MRRKDGTYEKKGMKGLRFALCKECKNEYNVSAFAEVSKRGYVCPKCRGGKSGKTKTD